jgi:hypothetical protein
VILLSIDPGAHAGQAAWRNGRLQTVGASDLVAYTDVLVVELPFAYPQNKTKCDPNDLISLAVKVGRLLERYDGAEHVTPTPQEWNRGAKKAWTAIRVWESLDEGERAVLRTACFGVAKSYENNLIDSVGIGLWYLREIAGVR